MNTKSVKLLLVLIANTLVSALLILMTYSLNQITAK